jgi:hypothetical protein
MAPPRGVLPIAPKNKACANNNGPPREIGLSNSSQSSIFLVANLDRPPLLLAFVDFLREFAKHRATESTGAKSMKPPRRCGGTFGSDQQAKA